MALAAVALVAKAELERAGEANAQRVVQDLGLQGRTDEQAAVALTRQVHLWYRGGRTVTDPPLLWRLRPYLTHPLLPEAFRLPPGLIDSLYAEGMCDSAARTLTYILAQVGIESRQLNVVQRFSGAHSAVVARFAGGREVLLDPLYGVVPRIAGALVSPQAVHSAPQGAVRWESLAPTSEDRFYAAFERAVFGLAGSDLEIEAPVDLQPRQVLRLGRADGGTRDVHREGMLQGLTHLWTYLGHRYDRGWTRVMRFNRDTRVTIGVVGTVNPRFVTTDVPPRIDGDRLVYEVAAGDALRFSDGAARRDWTKLRSYQSIDWILFEALL